jgi:hypothetical protein
MRPGLGVLFAVALAACSSAPAAALDGSALDGSKVLADALEAGETRESGAGDGPAATEGGLPGAAEFVAAYCARAEACCAQAGLPRPASCATALAASPGTFRAGMASACLAALSASCAGFASQSCDRVFSAVTATRHRGDACASDDECLLSSDGTVKCAAGHCQFTVPGKPGDSPCAGTASGQLTIPIASLPTAPTAYLCRIEEGVFCSDDSGACTVTKPAGAACASFGECGAGQYCQDPAGRCAPRVAEGAPCTVDEQCPSTVCAETNLCGRPVTPKLAGLCGQ